MHHNTDNIFPKLSEQVYLQAKFKSGCCSSNNKLHRRCACNSVNDKELCEIFCTYDTGCKGYAMRGDSTLSYCQLATNSSKCPEVDVGPTGCDIRSESNIEPLDINAKCEIGHWNGGCMIKKGIQLHRNPFPTSWR